MTTPHKWANVIKAWANGEKVQYRYVGFPDEWITTTTPNFHVPAVECRIKPETVKYRRYLWNDFGKKRLGIVDKYENVVIVESFSTFIHWIDDDWQEVIV